MGFCEASRRTQTVGMMMICLRKKGELMLSLFCVLRFLGGGGFMLNNFVPLRSHCALWARARGCSAFILCLVAKNEARKHAKGQALWKPARKPLRCSASLRKARLEGFVRRKFFVLFGSASKTGWAGDLCPTSGESPPTYQKRGSTAKTDLSNGRGETNEPSVGGESLDFPTRNLV